MSLRGQYAVVTGGSRGIGLEIARAFLEDGAAVLAVSRDAGKLAEAKRRLPSLHTLPADVSVPAQVSGVVRWVEQSWGRLDILVNNAGISAQGGRVLTQGKDEAVEETLRVNLLGPYYCTTRFLPFLLAAQRPRVINVGSTMGILSEHVQGAYGVSKVALNAMTIAMANELRGRVAVNVLSPGWVRTDMAPDGPGDPRDSAAAALWLAEQGPEVTGRFFDEGRGELPWCS